MLQVVKSYTEPENTNVVWLDMSVYPRVLKIYDAEGWRPINTQQYIPQVLVDACEEGFKDLSEDINEQSNRIDRLFTLFEIYDENIAMQLQTIIG